MSPRTTSWLARPSLWWRLLSQIRLAWRLVRDPAVPTLLKVVPLAAAAYVISPIDFVPDFLPILGQLDDAGVLLAAVELFLRWCPPDAVEFHRRAIARRDRYRSHPGSGEVIDAEYRRGD